MIYRVPYERTRRTAGLLERGRLEDHSDDGGDTKLGLDEMIGQFS
jgi:hypothetical protein